MIIILITVDSCNCRPSFDSRDALRAGRKKKKRKKMKKNKKKKAEKKISAKKMM